jgi:hypothetical protein
LVYCVSFSKSTFNFRRFLQVFQTCRRAPAGRSCDRSFDDRQSPSLDPPYRP